MNSSNKFMNLKNDGDTYANNIQILRISFILLLKKLKLLVKVSRNQLIFSRYSHNNIYGESLISNYVNGMFIFLLFSFSIITKLIIWSSQYQFADKTKAPEVQGSWIKVVN